MLSAHARTSEADILHLDQKAAKFTTCKPVFLDSFQFTASSLEQLADNLPADKFIYTSQVFQDEEVALMKKNGVYPYKYMDSFQKFGDQQLPPKDSSVQRKYCPIARG